MNRTEPLRERPTKDEHYLNRAKVAAEMSTCLRRKVGAVVIRDGVEVSSGYVGSPRGMRHCTSKQSCLRIELGVPSGQQYELCRSVHAEQNAIINASRAGVSLLGGVMYISSEKSESAYAPRASRKRKIYGPCLICKKEIINAGLKAVHMREEGVGTRIYPIRKIKVMLREQESKLKNGLKPSQSK